LIATVALPSGLLSLRDNNAVTAAGQTTKMGNPMMLFSEVLPIWHARGSQVEDAGRR
jgi:hypothetical protein